MRLGLRLVLALILAIQVLAAMPIQAQVIASGKPVNTAILNPLRTGVSAITLFWPVTALTGDEVLAAQASLEAIVTAPTEGRSEYDQFRYLQLNGIRYGVSLLPDHVALTVTAPQGAFSVALDLLETVLAAENYAESRYTRALLGRIPINETIHRRPEGIISALWRYFYHPEAVDTEQLTDMRYRFGQPSHAVMRSAETEHHGRLPTLLRALPIAAPLSRKSDDLRAFSLPRGVIHLADPNASETLIMLVHAKQFDDYGKQVAAHLLTDYIGAHQGSEMFRVLRQELRAAYSPKSTFEITDKHRAILALSATVEAKKWPAMLAQIKQIYSDVRKHGAARAGLEQVQRRLLNSQVNSFWSEPGWGALNFLREYPDGAQGTIRLPMLTSLQNADLDKISVNSEEFLPPIDAFLLIVIGGGPEPEQAFREDGYCRVRSGEGLQRCLAKLHP